MLHRTRPGLPRRRGASVVLTCFALMGILLLSALAVDSTSAMAARRHAQNCCDASALAGCIQLATLNANGKTPTSKQISDAANLSATNNNYTTGGNCTIAVNWPPTQGSFKGDASSVEVLLTFNYSNFVTWGGESVQVRSVASCNTGGSSSFPMLLTNPTGSNSFWVTSGDLTESKATIQVNSNNAKAAVVDGAAKSAANAGVQAVGGSSGSFTPAAQGGGSPMADPYALVPEPSTSGMNTYTTSQYYPDGSGNITLQPGYYPNGLYCINGGNVTLQPGVYYIESGNFWINTPGTVTGNGVTIFHAGSNSGALLSQDYGLNVGICLCPTNGNYTFTPPTTGPYAGMSFFQSRSYTGEAFYDFWGSGNLNVGVQYMPASTLRCWSANNGGAINCNELVAYNFKLTGTHEIYGNSQNGGFSNLTWNASRSANRPATSVYLAE